MSKELVYQSHSRQAVPGGTFGRVDVAGGQEHRLFDLSGLRCQGIAVVQACWHMFTCQSLEMEYNRDAWHTSVTIVQSEPKSSKTGQKQNFSN